MNKIIFILILSILSCSSPEKQKSNLSGFDISKMTKDDIYITYGLEASDSFYSDLQNNLVMNGFALNEFKSRITKENVLVSLIGISVTVDTSKIIKLASVQPSDYSNNINKLIEHQTIGIELPYEMHKNSYIKDYNFRIDIEKLCKEKN